VFSQVLNIVKWIIGRGKQTDKLTYLSCVAYRKCIERSGIFAVFHIHVGDQGSRRALSCEPDHLAHGVLFPLKHGLHSTVDQIAHPAGNAEGLGAPARRVAEVDTMHMPLDVNVRSCLAHICSPLASGFAGIYDVKAKSIFDQLFLRLGVEIGIAVHLVDVAGNFVAGRVKQKRDVAPVDPDRLRTPVQI